MTDTGSILSVNQQAKTPKKKKVKKQTNASVPNSVAPKSQQIEQNEMLQLNEESAAIVPDTNVPKNEDIFTIFVKSLTGSTLKLQISKADSTIEIKQLLAESIETCYVTSYELKINDVPLEDFSDISEYEGIEPDATLIMNSGMFKFLFDHLYFSHI
jgi:beta-galactosidase beta subunit